MLSKKILKNNDNSVLDRKKVQSHAFFSFSHKFLIKNKFLKSVKKLKLKLKASDNK